MSAAVACTFADGAQPPAGSMCTGGTYDTATGVCTYNTGYDMSMSANVLDMYNGYARRRRVCARC